MLFMKELLSFASQVTLKVINMYLIIYLCYFIAEWLSPVLQPLPINLVPLLFCVVALCQRIEISGPELRL